MDTVKTTVFHYTSYCAFRSIFTNSKGNDFVTFWATNVKYMNDTTELIFGQKKAKEFIYSLEKIYRVRDELKLSLFLDKNSVKLPNCYAISFSRLPDDLSMWCRYADIGQGVNLHFCDTEYSILLNKCKSFPQKYDIKILGGIRSYDMEYEDIELNSFCGQLICKEFEKYIQLANDASLNVETLKFNTVTTILMFGALLVKNKNFEKEEEKRLFYFDNNLDVKYKADNKTPYIEKKIPKSLITGITLGPTFDKSKKLELEQLLVENGMSNIDVALSDIPYRIK